MRLKQEKPRSIIGRLFRGGEKPAQPIEAAASRAAVLLRTPEPIDRSVVTQPPERMTGDEACRRMNTLPPVPTNRLLAGVALLNSLCSQACIEQALGKSLSNTHVEFHAGSDSVDIRIPDYESSHPYTIHITDYNRPQLWDTSLPDPTVVDLNVLYQYYVDLFDEQYQRALEGDTTPSAAKELNGLPINKHENEAGRMRPGEYPTVGEMYGMTDVFFALINQPVFRDRPANFAFGDVETVKQYFLDVVQRVTKAEQWNDPQDFTARQWITVLNASIADIPYDNRLASTLPEYDRRLAEQVNGMTIAELLERSKTGLVCRDLQRLKIAFYTIADAEYELSTRGVQMLPIAQYADAHHARDAYMIVNSAHDVTVVMTDTTNSDATVGAEQVDSGVSSATAWFNQQYGKEYLPSDVAVEVYDIVLKDQSLDIWPTTRAIAAREQLIALLEIAESEERAGQVDAARALYQRSYDRLNRQLDEESLMSNTEAGKFLRRPERTVPLIDLFIEVGKKVDTEQPRKINTVLALRELQSYVIEYNITPAQLQRARVIVSHLDIYGEGSSDVLRAIDSEIHRLEKQFGVAGS